MIDYRFFRNTDPPTLVEIWNRSFPGRSAVQLRSSYPLERFVFAKPFFDPAGVVIALDNNQRVGFVHAGFGPNAKEDAVCTDTGVICALGVLPSYRRQGIGTELLHRAEQYLADKGAKTVRAGAMKPYDPFYLGLYGGSDMPGFLTSDEAAAPFFESLGYRPQETTIVFQRRLDQPLTIADPRFAALRRQFELRVLPRAGVGSWWQEAVVGPLEPLEFRLEEIPGRRLAARTEVWEMETFSWSWGLPCVGLLNIEVREDLRRQGIGKFLVVSILRYLQEQYFALVEVQVSERNQPGVKLLQSLSMQQVDVGRTFRKEP